MCIEKAVAVTSNENTAVQTIKIDVRFFGGNSSNGMYITGDGVAILRSKAKVNGISSVRSTFSTLFGRWQQQCGLSLPALQQPVILIIKLANSQNLLAVFQQKPRCTRAASCPFSV